MSSTADIPSAQIKPLYWVPYDRDRVTAKSGIGEYLVDALYPEQVTISFRGVERAGRFGSIAEAKEWAESDYETRICACLVQQA
jgi:hypothetical protein